MSRSAKRMTRHLIFEKIKAFGRRAGELGLQVRHTVTGFGLRSTAHTDRWALPVKLLVDHRLVQRRRAFKQAGGARSGIARQAVDKARRHIEL
ncbi:MAG TPA: hypothetical protein PKD98_24565 [Anaerolineae bacterium]|nr:hypothetical protein [Anaerolineae bacterium]